MNRNEIRAFAATWMNLEIILSERSHKGEIAYEIPQMCNLKINDTNELTKEKETHRLRK